MRLALVAAALAVLTACPAPRVDPDGGASAGGSGGGTGTAGGGAVATPVGIDEFCERAPAVVCGLLERCGALRSSERAACEAERRAACMRNALALDGGNLGYSPAVAGTCLAALPTRSCGVVPDFTDFECRVFTAPSFPDVCGAFTCAAGTYCDGNACPVQCRTWRSPGETCIGMGADRSKLCDPERGYCEPGLADGGLGDGGTRRCQRFVAIGLACGSGDDRPCDPATAFCDLAGPGVCVAKRDAGAPCTRPNECPNDFCNASGRCGTVGLGGTCRNETDCGLGAADPFCKNLRIFDDGGTTAGLCSARIASGEACMPGPNIDDGCAVLGETCIGGRCATTEPFTRDAGADCDPFYKRFCAPPFFCGFQCEPSTWCRRSPDSSKGRCVPRLAAGAACDPNTFGPCADGLGCIGGRCQPFGDPGAPCSFPGECTGQLNCSEVDAGASECRVRPGLGARCPEGAFNRCGAGFCDRSVDGGTCAAKRQPGAACTELESCELGQCTGGACPTTCFR
ncbi:MAG: hypothetical protein JNK82_27275 [Myxococcaceae bacterium]|nr:hypothetical protein [Myxococcaceae bacterium]